MGKTAVPDFASQFHLEWPVFKKHHSKTQKAMPG